MTEAEESKYFRPSRKDRAKVSKYCGICNYTWEAGEEIYILSDPFELLCVTCGERFTELKQEFLSKRKEVSKVQTQPISIPPPSTDVLIRIEKKLDQIMEKLKI